MARPTKLTPAVQAAICESVRGGAWVEQAAEAAGVSASTVRGWLRRAEDHPDDCGPAFLEFHAAYKKARADAEIEAIGVIRAASQRSWQAAAWYLERSHPERWGRSQRIQVEQDPENAPITLRGLHALMLENADDD